MATHSSTLAWKIPWTEEPGRLLSMGSHRVRHDWTTSLSLFIFSCIGEGNGSSLQCSCLENPREGGAWWAAVSGVAQSWTRLKRLSSSIFPLTYLCRHRKEWKHTAFLIDQIYRPFIAVISEKFYQPLKIAEYTWPSHHRTGVEKGGRGI